MKKHLAAALALLLLVNCASYQVHQVAVKAPSEYPSYAEDEALAVAADPLDTKAKAESVFNVDLNRAGYLAVNVIIRNNGSEPFTLDKNSLYLVDSSGIQLLPTSADEMIQSVGTSLAKWYFISGFVGALSANRAKKKMNEDFHNKELREISIPSGITIYGFLYYQHQVIGNAVGYKFIVANSPTGEALQVTVK